MFDGISKLEDFVANGCDVGKESQPNPYGPFCNPACSKKTRGAGASRGPWSNWLLEFGRDSCRLPIMR